MEVDTPKEIKYQNIIESIQKADGSLIPLEGKRTRLNEKLFISVRYGKVDSLAKADSLLLIDVFAQEDSGQYKSIGHYDWEVLGKNALGNKNRHGGHLENLNDAQIKADKQWATGEAFKVYDKSFVSYAMEKGGFEYMNSLRTLGVITDEDQWSEPVYQKMGIGRLMIAASVVALESKGIERANLGSLTGTAEQAWKIFGQEEGKKADLKILRNDNNISESINKFI